MSRARTFTGLAALCAALLGTAPSQAYRMSQGASLGWSDRSYDVTCDNTWGFDHWNTRTLYWYLNTAGQGAGKETAVQQALATWSNAAVGVNSTYDLRYAGTASGLYKQGDNKNTMSWGTDTACNRTSCHAITAVFLQTPAIPSNGRVITEADILFNASTTLNFQWMTDGQYSASCWNTPGTSGLKLDTQGIATHELGHTLGIGHTEKASLPPSSSSPTMGSIGCTTEARSLTTDDTDAIRCSENRYPYNPVYEGELQVVTCREISGWAWNRNKDWQKSYVEITDIFGSSETAYVVKEAKLFDWDLWNAGIGNGYHAFSYVPDGGYYTGTWLTVGARYTGTGAALPGSPQQIICGATLFEEASPTENLSTGGQVYTVGTQFSSNRSGYVTELGFHRASGETGANTLRLWTDNGVELAHVTPSCNASGWCWGAISPVYVTANTLYRVTVNTNTYQSKTGCGIGQGITNDPLTAHSGYWIAGDTFPNAGSCSNFFVDVKFDI